MVTTKTFLWVSAVLAVLIIATALTPSTLWAQIAGLPAHPLVVHGVVVLLPLASIFVLVGLFLPKLLKKSHVVVTVVLGVMAINAVAARLSGMALPEVEGMPEFHVQWGTVLVPIAVAMFVIFVVFSLVTYYLPKPLISRLLSILLGILAVASVAVTIVVGHSGTASVWQDTVISETDAESSAVSESSQGETVTIDEPAPTREITLDEVALHNTPEDCWTVVDGNVYDLSNFVSSHPGGQSAIQKICGIDGTETFTGKHGGQGAPNQRLSTLKIGELAQ
jgi:cytochrome b involved in lipid metabolism